MPYATFEGALDSDRYPLDFHMIDKPKEFSQKVGTHEMPSNIYRQEMELKHNINVQSRARNSGGPAPYAADYSAAGDAKYSKDFVLQAKPKADSEPTGKVGAQGAFDPSVYLSQRAANQEMGELTRAKRFGAGQDPSHSAPFATSDAFNSLRQKEYYHAKPKKQDSDPGGKESYTQQDFDPAPYEEQLRENVGHQHDSTQRSFVGSGNILAPGAP